MSKRNAIKRFLSVWEIMFFVAMVGVISMLLFPRKEILSIILKNKAYVYPEFIKAVIRVDNNKNLKIALVRSYMKSGRYIKANKVLNGLHFNLERLNYINYISLKYRLLKDEYYGAKKQEEKEAAESKIKRLLSRMILVNSGDFDKYLSSDGKDRLAWMLDGYKFEYDMGNYKLALNLLQKYLFAYPGYKEKYYKNIILLYIATGENKKAYLLVNAYMKTHKNYNKKTAFFDTVVEKAILKKNPKLTIFLLKIYKEYFPNDLKIEKLILIYALQSGDPYFARHIALELSKGNK